MRKTLIPLLALVALALGGCEIYFGDGNGGGNDDYYEYCDETGCYYCDDWGCYPNGGGPVEPGSDCTSSAQCAQGCFCNAAGVCEETGFCNTTADCPSGMECNQSRDTCEPQGGCDDNADCPTGTYCELAIGECVLTDTCATDADCGLGYTCSNGSCVPAPCEQDADCMEGCYCDESSGVCEESGTCTSDADCAGTPATPYCDTDRNTCVSDDPTPGCQSDADCDGQRCETSANVCVDWQCSDYDEVQCNTNNATCTSVYGARCETTSGQGCQQGDPGCVCTANQFLLCEDN